MNTQQLGGLCAKIGSGATPRGGEKVYQREGVALIRSQNITNDGFTFDGLVYIDTAHADQLANVTVATRDVLLNITGESVARVCQVPDGVLPARVNQHVAIIRPHPDRLDPGYLRYTLASPETQARLHGLASAGATRRALTKQMIASLAFHLPALDEQRVIAGVLGALDDKIELNRRLNETLEELARLRFDSAQRSSVLPLNELVTLARDTVDPGSERDQRFEHFSIPAFDDGQTPVVEPGSAIKSSKLVVPPEAVLLSKLNPRIPRVWLSDLRDARRPICSTEFLVALPTERSSREFLYCLFRSNSFVDDFAGRVAGTSGSHQRVRAADALSIEVPVPDQHDLAELTALLRPLLDRAAANRRESRTLAELRDTLLPKLISGELRVRDIESSVGASGA